MNLKPGYSTTEFAAAALVAVAGVLPQFFEAGWPVQVAGLLAAAVSSYGYSQARARAKESAAYTVAAKP